MSSNLQQLLAVANEAQEANGIDMNEAVKGGQGSRLLPVGIAFAQLVEYVELGMHPQEFQGKAKDPALEFSLGFALTGQCQTPNADGTFEKYTNEDGTPYIVRPYSMALGRNEKSRAYKLFKAMNYKGTAKSFGQMLGQKWMVNIVHGPKSKSDPTIVSRIDLESFRPAIDPMSGQMYPIPDAPDSMYRLFSWTKPTLAAWDSLFIEGMYEAKDGKPAASKNRVQETILSALDFEGSPLQALLLANGKPIPVKAPAQAAVAVAPVVAAPSVSAAAVAPVSTPVAVVATATPEVVQPSAPAVVAAPVASPNPAQVAAPLAQPAPVVVAPGIAPVVAAAPNVVLPA